MKEKERKNLKKKNLTSNFQHLTTSKGITLIALVITIIVMLILVAVTISVAINGGLFEYAGKAVGETQNAIDAEQQLGNGKIQVGNLLYNSIGDYLNGIPLDNTNNEPPKWEQDENGNITYDGIPSDLKVGDYVDYEKCIEASGDKTEKITALYEELTKYSGFTDFSSYEGKTYETVCPIKKEDTLKWRVLDIKDGQIRLISEKPTTSKIFLYSYTGYNNAVYLIDKVCNTLYSTNKGKVQNLKIEDIEDKMNLEIWDFHDYEDTDYYMKYNDIIEITGSMRYYPAIFAKDKTGWLDGVQGTELDLSQQDEPIEQNEHIKAEKEIRVIQSYWRIDNTTVSNWKNEIYQNIFMGGNKSVSGFPSYWVSSREVQIGHYKNDLSKERAFFGCCYIYLYGPNHTTETSIKPSTLYDARGPGYPYYNSASLRPVVTLNANINLTPIGENSWQMD